MGPKSESRTRCPILAACADNKPTPSSKQQVWTLRPEYFQYGVWLRTRCPILAACADNEPTPGSKQRAWTLYPEYFYCCVWLRTRCPILAACADNELAPSSKQQVWTLHPEYFQYCDRLPCPGRVPDLRRSPSPARFLLCARGRGVRAENRNNRRSLLVQSDLRRTNLNHAQGALYWRFARITKRRLTPNSRFGLLPRSCAKPHSQQIWTLHPQYVLIVPGCPGCIPNLV